MKKIVLGGILGGFVLFFWSSISHMALPIGTAGLRVVPPAQEEAVLTALGSAMSERAIYFFPGLDLTRTLTPEEQQAWTVKYEAGPAGLVVYAPRPADRAFAGSVFATQLAIELVTNILAALLAAVVALSFSSALGYWPRVLLVGTLGLLATISVDASYWNWYGFPTSYLLAQLADHVVGWLLAGLVLARVCRR